MQKLNNMLIEQGWLNAQQCEDAHMNATNGIIAYLVKNKLIASESLARLASKLYGRPFVNLNNFDIKRSCLPIKLLKKITAIPFREDEELHIAIADPSQLEDMSPLHFLSEKPIKTYIGDYFKIVDHLKNLEQQEHSIKIKEPEKNSNGMTEKQDDPLIHFLNNIFQAAFDKQATDIHIEHYEDEHRIRFRIDGLLQRIESLPAHIADRLITRIKLISQLDIAESRLPQDGYCQFNANNIRVSTCPTIYGEKVVLRLLPVEKSWKLNELKLSQAQATQFIHAIEKPQGLILVTGPTGSGKTVTLYAAIQHLLSEERNICSVEDPVEIRLKGVNQVSVNLKANLNFSNILKTFLRQDPDIIMIGEIRDLETAQIAIRAAQTGHLVLATLHTNSTLDTINRLTTLGISSYDVVSQVTLITAQRLLRKKTKEGYQGRFAIHEILLMDDEIASAIIEKQHVNRLMKEKHFISLEESAKHAVQEGLTTEEEVKRVLG